MPKLYDELADWWPLMSAPEDYEEEAAFYAAVLAGACARPPRTVLELGSGGGNNASHLRARFEMVLVEPSAGMLAVSRALNLAREHDRHVEGLFARADWLRLLSAAGFEPRAVRVDHSELEPGSFEIFVAARPAAQHRA